MDEREYAKKYIKLQAKVDIAKAEVRTYAKMFGRGSAIFSVVHLKNKCQCLIEAERALSNFVAANALHKDSCEGALNASVQEALL